MKTNYITNNINYTFEISKIIFKIYWYFIREIIKCEPNSVSDLINEEKSVNLLIEIDEDENILKINKRG